MGPNLVAGQSEGQVSHNLHLEHEARGGLVGWSPQLEGSDVISRLIDQSWIELNIFSCVWTLCCMQTFTDLSCYNYFIDIP